MNLVPENINEAIKHLQGRSEEDIKTYVQKIIDETGYTPDMKKDLLLLIKQELRENRRRTQNKFKNRKPVEFLSLNLNYIKYYLKRDFRVEFPDDASLIEHITYDLKRLVTKYKFLK